jgi:hypothetical protein
VNYRWTTCPGCSCELAIHFVERPDGLSGSLRRWSVDRTINDGRPRAVARAEISPDGAFRVACVCGTEIAVDPSTVERATTERPA